MGFIFIVMLSQWSVNHSVVSYTTYRLLLFLFSGVQATLPCVTSIVWDSFQWRAVHIRACDVSSVIIASLPHSVVCNEFFFCCLQGSISVAWCLHRDPVAPHPLPTA
jgi:hypothetical protein